MNRLDYFLAAMRAESYLRRSWVFSAFSLIQEASDKWKEDPYPYRIVQTPAGHFFVDPAKNLQLTKLEDDNPIVVSNSMTVVARAYEQKPPFSIKDRVQLKGTPLTIAYSERSVPHLVKDIETNYGNLLANYICLVYPFKDKMPYLEGKFSPGMLEELILPRLKDEDDPIAGQWKGIGRDPKWIYVDEYLKFSNAMFYIASFASLWVPAGTKKSLTAPPGIIEYRTKLIEENKDRLHDPEVIAGIAKKLQEYDLAWLKGDDSLNFMISKKSFEVVRAKKFLMVGAEVGLSEGINVDLIQNSLSEGWDIEKFPQMNNSLRAGSYNRGAQTMLGGESVKWLLRASSNINITTDDCGSTMGTKVWMHEKNIKRYLGFSIITQSGPVALNEENSAQFLNQLVKVRSPMYCWLDKTDYCKCCVGPRLAANPTGASSAISEYGSKMMLLYMKAAHGKALKTARLNWREQLQ